jgi:hypothetical protein
MLEDLPEKQVFMYCLAAILARLAIDFGFNFKIA